MKPKIKNFQNERLYNIDIPIIGLTGGIATGKSACSQNIKRTRTTSNLRRYSCEKNIYQREETIAFIQTEAPETINDNKIDFKLLRRSFFQIMISKQRIENFIYSHLQSEFFKNIPADAALVIYDVPLLFEKILDSKFDLVILCYAKQKHSNRKIN